MFDLNFFKEQNNKTENKLFKQYKKDMNQKADIANKLYKKALSESIENKNLLDPVQWIFNQDKMRKAWEDYLLILNDKPSAFKNIMINNSFGSYMQFMYDTYPPNFGKQLKEQYNL